MKKTGIKKPKKYDELPEIPDYERPALEKYEESDFTPTPYVKQELEFGQREPEQIGKKSVEKPSQQATKSEGKPTEAEEAAAKKAGVKKPKKSGELPEIDDYERPKLEKYEESEFTPTPYNKEDLEFGERESQKSAKKFGRKASDKPDDSEFTPSPEDKGELETTERDSQKARKFGRKPSADATKPAEQPEEKVPESLAKKTGIKKPKKYEELPQIPDYERPELEKYEESNFTPTPYVKQELNFAEREPENPPQKAKVQQAEEPKELPKIAEAEKTQLEKYKKTEIEKPKKVEAEPEKKLPVKKEKTVEEEEEEKKPKKLFVKKANPTEPEKFTDLIGMLRKNKPRPKKPGEDDPKEEEIRRKSLTGGDKPDLSRLKLRKPSKVEDLPEIAEYEKPKLETYEKTDFELTKKEEVPNKSFKLGKGKPKPEESAEVTINPPKGPLKSSTGESADAKILTKSQNPHPPTIVEESASKDIVIKDNPVANKPKKRYDPMAYIPDKEDETPEIKITEPTFDPPSPEPQSRIRPKYDPLKFIPEKDVDDTEVNTFTQLCRILLNEVLSFLRAAI